jgi:hypothetical protein
MINQKSYELEMQEQGRDQTALLNQLVDNANRVPEPQLTRRERREEALGALMTPTKMQRNNKSLESLTAYYANR